MKKKACAAVLCLSMTAALLGCGSQESTNSAETAASAETTETADAEETSEEADTAQSEAAGSATYTAGTYSASSKGHEADVTVTAEFDDSSITSVTVDASGETETIGAAAAADLESQFLEAQSAEIDGVTGATETSNAAKRAMQDVIDQAQGKTTASTGEEERTPVSDGTYTETTQSFGFTGDMEGEVTFQDGKITDIVITKETDSETGQWFETAESLLIPRIIEAQSIGVDSITGATTSSGAIKTIVDKAITEAGGDSSEWYTEPEKSTDTITLEGYDVIVVGLGGSGILSYAAAADTGASVFGIEAAGAIGGNSASVYGPMALNSENLKEKYNNGEDYIDEDAVYDAWIDYVGTDEKADVIKKAVYESGSALDYYMDNFDFSFDGMNGLLGSFVNPEWDKEWTVYTADEDNTKWYILGPDHTFQFTHCMEKAKAMNEKNDYMTELHADELITDEDGNVTGVRATYRDGTTYEIYGKSVILATGGFLGNEEMCEEYLGAQPCIIGDSVNQGDGIQMGQSVGGATYAMKTLPMIHISQVPNIIRTDELTADEKAILSALALTSDMPEVNVNGEPYGNTDATGTQDSTITVGIVYAPEYRYYTVYTDEDIEKIRTEGLSEAQSTAEVAFIGNGGTLPEAGTPVENIDTILEVGEKYGDVFTGTPEELADEIGCDADTLTETLGDADTNYTLVCCAGYSYGTVGGLDVDENMNVLKEDGTPIENLFAVGQDSEGVENQDGKAYTPWGGQAQSWTFVSGKTAGQKAAELAGYTVEDDTEETAE